MVSCRPILALGGCTGSQIQKIKELASCFWWAFSSTLGSRHELCKFGKGEIAASHPVPFKPRPPLSLCVFPIHFGLLYRRKIKLKRKTCSFLLIKNLQGNKNQVQWHLYNSKENYPFLFFLRTWHMLIPKQLFCNSYRWFFSPDSIMWFNLGEYCGWCCC